MVSQIDDDETHSKIVCTKCWEITRNFHELYSSTRLTHDTFLTKAENVKHIDTECLENVADSTDISEVNPVDSKLLLNVYKEEPKEDDSNDSNDDNNDNFQDNGQV